MLCRAGLRLGSTTVGRMLKEFPAPKPPDSATSPVRVVTAKEPNQVWHVNLTAVPTGAGLWAPWSPFALPQCWPFCWWIAVVIDHYSRRAMAFAVFSKRPTSVAISAFLGKAICSAKRPKYLVCYRDKIFTADNFKRWLKRKHIKHRYGAVGQHGSIAVVERFIRTMKNESRPHSALDSGHVTKHVSRAPTRITLRCYSPKLLKYSNYKNR